MERVDYLEEVIEDLIGYVRFATDKKARDSEILMNVVHDLAKVWRKDKFFVPRTKGYKKWLK